MLSASARSMLLQRRYLSYQQAVSVLVGRKAMTLVRYVMGWAGITVLYVLDCKEKQPFLDWNMDVSHVTFILYTS
jgi:hypothetical protein